jgi:hypothetical protein
MTNHTLSEEEMGIDLQRRRKRKTTKTVDQNEDNACTVLIKCGQPAEDGKMQVEMVYEGDASLAAYLIESAQGIIDPQN